VQDLLAHRANALKIDKGLRKPARNLSMQEVIA